MYRLITLPLLVAGFMLGVGGLITFQHDGGFQWLLCILLGLGLVILAYRYDGKKVSEQKSDKQKVVQALLDAEVPTGDWPCNKVFRTKCSSVFGVAMFSIAVTLFSLGGLLNKPHVMWLIGCLIFIPVSLMTVYRLAIEIGDHQLEFSVAGFKGPGYGLIPWQAVEGIDRCETSHRGRVVGVQLIFLIAEPLQFLAPAHPLRRLLYPFLPKRIQSRISFPLATKIGTSELAEKIARKLWSQVTGKTHNWLAMASDEFNTAVRAGGDSMARLRVAVDAPAMEQMDDLAKLRYLEQLSADAQVVRAAVEATNREQGRLIRQFGWAIGVLVVVFVVSLLLRR